MTGMYNQSDSSLADLHKRVEQLLSGHSIATTEPEPPAVVAAPQAAAAPQSPQSPYYDVGPPPSYEQHIERQQGHEPFAALQARLSQLSITEEEPVEQQTTLSPPTSNVVPALTSGLTPALSSKPPPISPSHPNQLYSPEGEFQYVHLYTPENVTNTDNTLGNPPLSPISESSSGVCNNLSGINTRSVSAAVSDESVAGDSGVFEASHKLDVLEMAAQVQIKLQ